MRVHKPSVHHTVVVSVRGCCDRCVNTAVGSRTLFFELCRVLRTIVRLAKFVYITPRGILAGLY